MRRREFIALLGGSAIAWPVAARAQQPAMPVIGFLGIESPESDAVRLTGIRQGLNETGYVEGRNFAFEYRGAGNQLDRLPAMAAELVHMRVAIIVTPGVAATLAAKAATPTIPILFGLGVDPVQYGLVASLSRPGGNVTGSNQLSGELAAKALALLHELVSKAAAIGFLQNPTNPTDAVTARDVLAAAPAIGIKVQVLNASTDRELDAAFESLVPAQTAALLVANDIFFNSRIEKIVGLAARHAIPVMYPAREFVLAGGLTSYGGSLTELYRQIGLYAGRIFKGERPANLPVIQASKLALVINLKTAKALGLEIPAKLLATADEVID